MSKNEKRNRNICWVQTNKKKKINKRSLQADSLMNIVRSESELDEIYFWYA